MAERCKQLEQELRKYRLWANLVPEGSWEVNLKRLMSQREWDVLRRTAYAHYHHKCAICGASGVVLHAHEEWEYNYERSEQRLTNIVALCWECHMCNHLGFAAIQASEGKLDMQKLIEHWAQVNGQEEAAFRDHEAKAFELWQLRNQFQWRVLTPRGEAIRNGLEAKSIIEAIRSSESGGRTEKLQG